MGTDVALFSTSPVQKVLRILGSSFLLIIFVFFLILFIVKGGHVEDRRDRSSLQFEIPCFFLRTLNVSLSVRRVYEKRRKTSSASLLPKSKKKKKKKGALFSFKKKKKKKKKKS